PILIGPLYHPPTPPPAVAGVTADDAGRIYLAVPADKRVWRVALDPGGALESVESWPAGVAPARPGALRPTALLSAGLGLLWAAEPDSARVRFFDCATGALRGEAAATLDRPTFLAIDGCERIYVSDASGVHRFSPDGQPDPMANPVA